MPCYWDQTEYRQQRRWTEQWAAEGVLILHTDMWGGVWDRNERAGFHEALTDNRKRTPHVSESENIRDEYETAGLHQYRFLSAKTEMILMEGFASHFFSKYYIKFDYFISTFLKNRF